MAKYDPLLRHLADAGPESVEMTLSSCRPMAPGCTGR